VSSEKENFQVLISSTDDDSTDVITTMEGIDYNKILSAAWDRYTNKNGHVYSVIPKDNFIGKSDLTDDEYARLSKDAQSNLASILRINQLSRQFINKDDLIGKVYEIIGSNVNSNVRLSYEVDKTLSNYEQTIEKAKKIISDFNKKVKIDRFIRDSIPMTYAEGNYVSYLRGNKSTGYSIDYYPLGLSIISDYEINGEPVVLLDLKYLESALQKTMVKTKKGKAYFFNKTAEEIQKSYPVEVHKDYINKEIYSKLDTERSGVIRINNLKRKYGLTPIFRTLKSAGMLEMYEKADKLNASAVSKKIIMQKLHKEIMGDSFNDMALDKMAYAHEAFIQAFNNEVVIYTAPPFVEDLKYIEPKVETNNTNQIKLYRNKTMTALGIAFVNNETAQTFTVANISIAELLKVINKISEQVESCIEKWYEVVLRENGIGSEYVPKVKIIDSETFSNDVKVQLVEVLFSKMNMSYKTAFELLGYSLEEEVQRRREEKDNGVDEVFTPRLNAYTASGDIVDNNGGRPVDNNNPDKQNEDQDRRKAQ